MWTASATIFPPDSLAATIGDMPRTKSEKKMVTVSARVELEVRDSMVDLAKRMGAGRPFKPTVSQLLGAAIEEYVAKYSRKYPKK
jgi:hypothetical protein